MKTLSDDEIKYMDWLIPGYKGFVKPERDYIEPPEGFRAIEVKYIPSELKARYSYHWNGIPNKGIKRILGKWAVAPTHGLQFDPMGILEDL